MARIALIVLAGAASLLGASAEKMLKVYGQSGKFKVYENGTDDADSAPGILVVMDELKEVDSSGNEVGTSGNIKHSVNTFASQTFTIDPLASGVILNDAVADMVKFSASVGAAGGGGGVGTLFVETYLFTEGGNVTNGVGGETWEVAPGDVKWNIGFSSWDFCGCSQGQTQQVGEYLDLTITVTGLGTAKKKGGSDKEIEIGDGVKMMLASKVKVDGNLTDMPAGYPKVELQGQKTKVTFRFPKFESDALYDPTISYDVNNNEPNDPNDPTPRPVSGSPGVGLFAVLPSLAVMWLV